MLHFSLTGTRAPVPAILRPSELTLTHAKENELKKAGAVEISNRRKETSLTFVDIKSLDMPPAVTSNPSRKVSNLEELVTSTGKISLFS